MARKTDGEKIDELEKVVATLIERVDAVQRDIEGIAELKRDVAVLEERLNELKRVVEEAGRKRWAVLPPLIGAIVGAALTLLLQLLLHSLRGR
jgi:hypothetical protein